MAIAAPEAIADGAIIGAIAGCLLLLGLLRVAKGFVQALFSIFPTNAPIVGHFFKGIVQAAENSLLNWIDSAIVADQVAIAHLLSGLTWLLDQTYVALEETATATDDAFDYLVRNKIPAIAGAVAADSIKAAHDAANGVTGLATKLSDDVTTLEGKITHGVSQAESYTDTQIRGLHTTLSGAINDAISTAEKSSGSLIGSSIDFLTKRITTLQGTLEDEIDAAKKAAIAAITPAVSAAVSGIALPNSVTEKDITNAIADALGAGFGGANSISSAITTAVNNAVGAIKSGGGTVTGDVAQQIDNAINAAVAAGGVVDADIQNTVSHVVQSAIAGVEGIPGDIQSILDDIETKLSGITALNLPQIAALVATLTATVAALESEAGLDDPSCRAKNKGICGTDPTQWFKMLAGLVAVEEILNFDQLVQLCEDGFSDSESIVEALT